MSSARLLGPLFSTDEVQRIFSDEARLQGMLDFEAALARALIPTGIAVRADAEAIATQCRAELYDIEAIGLAAKLAGNPVIPLIEALTARVSQHNPAAARFVHWGATSQDAMDTGLVLQLRAALERIEMGAEQLAGALAALAQTHANTTMPGRTWLQQAVPITFGLKAAGWLSAVERHRARLRELRPRVQVVQFGGAAGTLAALGDQGMQVATALAHELELVLPDSPWHTQRDRLAEVATVLGLLVGTLGKMARDVALLMQTEVGEALESQAARKGGSSTMPHKRNPVGSAAVLAAAARVPGLVSTMLGAMGHEHERGLGAWQAEWETLPQVCTLADGALANVVAVIGEIEIDAARMRKNLQATDGLIFAEAIAMVLAARIGRASAHALLQEASRQAIERKQSLRDVLATDARVTSHLAPAALDELFDPARYLGSTQAIIARVLAGVGVNDKKK